MGVSKKDSILKTLAYWRERAVNAEESLGKANERLAAISGDVATLATIILEQYGGPIGDESAIQAASRILDTTTDSPANGGR